MSNPASHTITEMTKRLHACSAILGQGLIKNSQRLHYRHVLLAVRVRPLQRLDELHEARLGRDEMPVTRRQKLSWSKSSCHFPPMYLRMCPLLTYPPSGPAAARVLRHTRLGCPCGQGSERGGRTCHGPGLRYGCCASWSVDGRRDECSIFYFALYPAHHIYEPAHLIE
jgi:hypothetical protein